MENDWKWYLVQLLQATHILRNKYCIIVQVHVDSNASLVEPIEILTLTTSPGLPQYGKPYFLKRATIATQVRSPDFDTTFHSSNQKKLVLRWIFIHTWRLRVFQLGMSPDIHHQQRVFTRANQYSQHKFGFSTSVQMCTNIGLFSPYFYTIVNNLAFAIRRIYQQIHISVG